MGLGISINICKIKYVWSLDGTTINYSRNMEI